MGYNGLSSWHPNADKWELTSNSLAIGAGVNGEDCGPFSGTAPYIPSGIPAIPSIYYFKGPAVVSTVNTGLPVQIKVKANK